MGKIFAPFTEDQVRSLTAWQERNVHYANVVKLINVPNHPFTCCSHNGCERLQQPNEGALILTTDGWVCPCGEYKQNWCHDFMVAENRNKQNNDNGKC